MNATTSAPAAPATAKAPSAPATSAAPAAPAASKPVTPKSQEPTPVPAGMGESKPQTSGTKPPQTPAGDKAEAAVKERAKQVIDNAPAANKHSPSDALKGAGSKGAKPNLPVGAQGNTSAEHKAAGVGDNSRVTRDEIEKVAKQVGDSLAGVMNADGRIEKAKGQADTLRKEAAANLFPVFDRIGLEPEWGKEFSAKAKEFDEFNELQRQVCEHLSKKVKDPIEYTSKGVPIFSGRVKKAWSRLTISYREGGDGGQTKADSSARDAAKERAKTNTAKAEMMDHIIIAHKDGNAEKVDTLLKSAAAQWGKALGV